MLSLLLLVAAGLFLKTLRNLQRQDYGFERTFLLLAQFDAKLAGYTSVRQPASTSVCSIGFQPFPAFNQPHWRVHRRSAPATGAQTSRLPVIHPPPKKT